MRLYQCGCFLNFLSSKGIEPACLQSCPFSITVICEENNGQSWRPKHRSGKVDFNNENPSACEAAGVTTPNGTAPAAVTVNINVRMWLSASHDTV